MRPFEYLEPASLAEACSLLSEHSEAAKIIAGGQSLLPMLKQRLLAPRYLINIKGLLNLEYITAEPKGVKIGALTTHRAVENSPLIKEKLPLLAQMERVVASVQIRNWGTLGGNLCHADPSGDPGPVLIALGARVRATSVRGTREIPLSDFFADYLESVLEPDEILTEIEVPHLPPRTGTAHIKEAVRFGDNPIVSVAAVVTLEEDIVRQAQIVFGAVDKTPISVEGGIGILVGQKVTPEVLEGLAETVAAEIEPTSDVVASADYKRELAKIITKQAVNQAIAQAR